MFLLWHLASSVYVGKINWISVQTGQTAVWTAFLISINQRHACHKSSID